jgi:hypothetical protein
MLRKLQGAASERNNYISWRLLLGDLRLRTSLDYDSVGISTYVQPNHNVRDFVYVLFALSV